MEDVTALAIVAADWAKERKKRAVYVARHADGWKIYRQLPPPAGWNLSSLLDTCRSLRARRRGPVLLGIDVVLGLPAAFSAKLGVPGFLDALQYLERTGGLCHECPSQDEWTPEIPFFRVPSGAGGLGGFIDAAGGRHVLLRQVEKLLLANSVFALSGIPGTVGSGSRAFWRELVQALRSRRRTVRVWPFEGEIDALFKNGSVILGEAYPRAAYGIVLSEVLPTRPVTIAKTQRAARESAIGALEKLSWPRRLNIELRDFDCARQSEDDFDALLTAGALLRLVLEGQPLSCEPVDPRSEGGILATGGISPQLPRRQFNAGSSRFVA